MDPNVHAGTVIDIMRGLCNAFVPNDKAAPSAPRMMQVYRRVSANRPLWCWQRGGSELMHHASIWTTRNVYVEATSSSKRERIGEAVEMVLKPVAASA